MLDTADSRAALWSILKANNMLCGCQESQDGRLCETDLELFTYGVKAFQSSLANKDRILSATRLVAPQALGWLIAGGPIYAYKLPDDNSSGTRRIRVTLFPCRMAMKDWVSKYTGNFIEEDVSSLTLKDLVGIPQDVQKVLGIVEEPAAAVPAVTDRAAAPPF